MKKQKKYIPQAGDLCEWDFNGLKFDVIIVSSEKNEDDVYEGFSQEHLKFILSDLWQCELKDLTLICRP